MSRNRIRLFYIGATSKFNWFVQDLKSNFTTQLNTFGFVLIIGLLMSFLYVNNSPVKIYNVKVTFCDKREPIFILVKRKYPFTNRDIENMYSSLPTFLGYINVCEVKTVDTSKTQIK